MNGQVFKFIFIIPLCFYLKYSNGQDSCCNIVYSDSLYLFDNKPFSGECNSYNKKCCLKKTMTIKEGKVTTIKRYYNHGELKKEYNFINGKQPDKHFYWNRKGEKYIVEPNCKKIYIIKNFLSLRYCGNLKTKIK